MLADVLAAAGAGWSHLRLPALAAYNGISHHLLDGHHVSHGTHFLDRACLEGQCPEFIQGGSFSNRECLEKMLLM